MRELFKLLSLLGDLKAITRGPGSYVKRQGRKAIVKSAGKASRKVLKP